jgi:hypothetical protein
MEGKGGQVIFEIVVTQQLRWILHSNAEIEVKLPVL